MQGKIAVYTCITKKYDVLLSPREIESDVDYICFTDNIVSSVAGWRNLPIPVNLNGASANRFLKMNPHLFLSEYKYSIYLDGNIEIIGNLKELVQSSLSNTHIALYEHPFRNCIYEEAKKCVFKGHDWFWKISQQIDTYKLNEFPEKKGLFECNVIIRNHHHESIQKLMESWWDLYRTGVKRDQLSLMYLLWKHGIIAKNLGKSDPRYINNHFFLHKHSTKLDLRRRFRSIINKSFSQWEK